PEADRPRLHLMVANAVEAVYGGDPSRAVQLADHFQMAGDLNKRLKYLLAAARHARAISRHEECRRLCEEALELLTAPDEQRMATLSLLGDAYVDGDEFAQAEKGYMESLRLGRRLHHIAGAGEALIGLGAV